MLYRNLTVNSERPAKCSLSLSPSASLAAASTLSLSIIKQYNYHPVSQSVILPHGWHFETGRVPKTGQWGMGGWGL